MRTDALEFVQDAGIALKIWYDQDADNPRNEEENNLGTLVAWHPRYRLGDPIPFEAASLLILWESLYREAHPEDTQDEIPEATLRTWVQETYLVLPCYLLDHSGLSMQCSDFADPWDSGLVGVIYVDRAKVQRLYGVSQNAEPSARLVLQDEVARYSDYLAGAVYGYTIEAVGRCESCGHGGEILDGCWGFYGSDHCTNGLTEMVACEYPKLAALLCHCGQHRETP